MDLFAIVLKKRYFCSNQYLYFLKSYTHFWDQKEKDFSAIESLPFRHGALNQKFDVFAPWNTKGPKFKKRQSKLCYKGISPLINRLRSRKCGKY